MGHIDIFVEIPTVPHKDLIRALLENFNHYNPKTTVARIDMIKTSAMKIQSRTKSTS